MYNTTASKGRAAKTSEKRLKDGAAFVSSDKGSLDHHLDPPLIPPPAQHDVPVRLLPRLSHEAISPIRSFHPSQHLQPPRGSQLVLLRLSCFLLSLRPSLVARRRSLSSPEVSRPLPTPSRPSLLRPSPGTETRRYASAFFYANRPFEARWGWPSLAASVSRADADRTRAALFDDVQFTVNLDPDSYVFPTISREKERERESKPS
jgi:hypothetical protein